jgi:rubrerythrin
VEGRVCRGPGGQRASDLTGIRCALPHEVIEHLNRLIQLDADAAQLYRMAIEHVDHIADLTRAVIDLGGEPEEPSRDITGVLFEGVAALRMVTGTNGALSAMRMNERHTNHVYDEALDNALPPLAYELVLQHLEDERRHLAVIEMHMDRLAADRTAFEFPDIRGVVTPVGG